MRLYFNPQAFPRTIGREEWREIWRWKRKVEKELEIELTARMQNFAVYGTTLPDHIRDDIISKTINPPLSVHEKQRW